MEYGILNFSKRSLDKLLLCNNVRELIRYRVPVMAQDCFFLHKLLVDIARSFDASISKHLRGKIWTRILINPINIVIIILLRAMLIISRMIRLLKKGFFSYLLSPREVLRDICIEIVDTLRAIRKNSRFCKISSSTINGYVVSSDKEEPLIRIGLLLRIMKNFGSCIDFLIQRHNSGLSFSQTRSWLLFFLNEVGISNSARLTTMDNAKGRVISSTGTRKLKYGIVMTVMFESDVFQRSLLSLLESDFEGEIVVVEDGNTQERSCENFCRKYSVKYVKNPKWDGTSASMNRGIERLRENTDIVIYAHNDVLWPPSWHAKLDNEWQRVYALDKIGIINLGFLQFSRQFDVALNELFLSGRYDDLFWVLTNMRDVPDLLPFVFDIGNKNAGVSFGLANDFRNNCVSKVRFMAGVFSVGASFQFKLWKDIGGFEPEMSNGFVFELIYHCLQGRKWITWINNTPLIHFVSSDTSKLSPTVRSEYGAMVRKTYKLFEKKYGLNMEHMSVTFFGEACIIYQDEIIKAINELRFSDIDFIFDRYFESLKKKTLKSCELVWCRGRSQCSY